tara:strand:- start:241 stop:570 length:330 start_codon:yes stop_codon:yes gene_type:complete
MLDKDYKIIKELQKMLNSRKKELPENSYVSLLFQKGNSVINSKIIEEASEYIEAVNSDKKSDIIHEAADLWFHNLVSLTLNDIQVSDILEELNRRFGVSGLEEKKSRDK